MVTPENIPLHNDSSEAGTSTSIKSKSSRKKRKEKRYVLKSPIKKKSHVGEFLNALAIYGFCVSLPTICYLLKSWFEASFTTLNGGGSSYSDDEYVSMYGIDGTSSASLNRNIPLVVENNESVMNLFRKTADELWSPFAKDHYHDDHSLLGLPTAVYLFIRHLIQTKRDALSDVQFVIAASLLLSLIRVLIVQMLVPRYLAPRSLKAMVKTKSTHLLSSQEYRFLKNELSDGDGDEFLLGSLGDGTGSFADITKSDGRRSSMKEYANDFMVHTINSVRRSLGHETQAPYNDMDERDAVNLFAAPRYATAIFRLLFCLFSCSWALWKFSSANFWPVWVGGQPTASTKNCWDLSGMVALQGASLDSDFDHQNSALRYFFLSQASYQMHSICFHVLSMFMLVIYGGSDGYLSARKSLTSYSMPMLVHTIYFVLTVGTYIFSGLRRLGAITIFALELSSMMLQFLQICINAPDSSPLRDDRLAKFVHNFLAVPVFIYCRFFVMPFIVQYSAAFESALWLQQIDKAFHPGVGTTIYILFNGMLLLACGFNFEYLRRLLFHPFVKKLKKSRKSQGIKID